MKRPHLLVLLRTLAALFCVTSFPLSGAAQEDDPARSAYTLRSGDRIQIDLYTSAGVEVAVVRGERYLDVNGEVFLPYIGTVNVLGLDQSALRLELTERYTPFFSDPILDVQVDLRVSVTGSVRLAGGYYLPPTSTILDAIAEAGGMSPELTAPGLQNLPANQSAVRLVRDGVTHILNLRPDEAVDSILRLPIQSGDWIHVPNLARSRVRDELQFWGGVLSFVANVVAVVLLVGNNN